MARRPGTHVPKFGNWDANDHMPYTVVFDHARQGRGKPINPNDPAENPSLFPAGRGNGAPGRRMFNPNDPEDSHGSSDLHQERPSPEKPHQERAPLEKPQQDRPGIRDVNIRGQQPQQVAAGAAARRQVAAVPTQSNGMPPSRTPPVDPKRTSRDSTLERSVESPSTSFSADQSPSHPAGYQSNQGRGTRLGAASPAWDPPKRKSSGEDGQMFAPATPNRSRLWGGSNAPKEEGSAKGQSAALPKFGAWDDQDPGSGDGFTVIFNNAISEKKSGGPVNIPRTPDHNKHGDDLYEPSSHVGYQRGGGAKKNWFCWCAPDVKS